MNSRMGSVVDFEPPADVVPEEDCDILLLYLPGFKKEQLRVQITSAKTVRVSGSRQTEDNKVSRFQRDFPVSTNCDSHNATAIFEYGILYIRLPKLITSEDQKQDEKLPDSEAARPDQKPADDQSKDQKSTSQEQDTEKSTVPEDPSRKNSAESVPQMGQDDEGPKVAKSSESNELKNTEKKSADDKVGSLDDSIKKTRSPSDGHEEDSMKAADNMDKETADGSSKTEVQNKMDSAVDSVSELKMPIRVMNVVLVGMSALALGLYITNFIRSLKTAEKSE